MCGLVTFMVDTAAALAKYITEQERGNGGGLTSCSCLLLKSLVDFWPDLPNHLSIRWEGDKNKMSKRWIQRLLIILVGATGFEPATTWSQTRSATGLRYTPNILVCGCKGSKKYLLRKRFS